MQTHYLRGAFLDMGTKVYDLVAHSLRNLFQPSKVAYSSFIISALMRHFLAGHTRSTHGEYEHVFDSSHAQMLLPLQAQMSLSSPSTLMVLQVRVP